jgi:hypothetical protein
MSAIARIGVAALWVATAAAGQIPSAPLWDLADAETVRLAPEKVDTLPLPMRQELARLGCTIPQVPGSARPANIITGRFFSSSEPEIAVLCSRDRISSILVFGGEFTKPIAEFAAAPDRDYLVDAGDGRIVFTRLLQVAHPKTIRRYHADYGGPEPPSLEHEGIEESFLEKASIVWYWHAGRWLQLTGAD